MTQDERFRKQDRLRLQRDFDRIFALKCSAGDGVLVVYAAPNGLPHTRIGIRTGRALGGAVLRNYARRRIREAFRRSRARLPAGFDLIIIARLPCTLRVTDVAASLVEVAGRACRKAGGRSRIAKSE